jgi:hypothetical protein
MKHSASFLILVILLVFPMISLGVKPVQTYFGTFFPGRGCGGSTEIKYLYNWPEDTSGLTCTWIVDENKVANVNVEHAEEANPDQECFEENTMMWGTYAGIFTSAVDAQTCHQHCHHDRICKYFRYRVESRMCELYSTKDGSQHDTDYISGPSECL